MKPSSSPSPTPTFLDLLSKSFDIGIVGPFAVSSDGVWAFSQLEGERRATLVKLDPRTGNVVRIGMIEEPYGEVLLRRDEVWVFSSYWDDSNTMPWTSAIQRWDRETLAPITTSRYPGAVLGSVISAGHSIWVSNYRGEGPDEVWEIDPSTGEIAARIEVGAEATRLLEARSKVWITDSIDGTIRIIDPISQSITQLETGRCSTSSMATFGGSLWASGCRGFFEIDLATERIIRKIRPKSGLFNIGSAFSGLWSQGIRRNQLIGIDPVTGELTGERIELAAAPSYFQGFKGRIFVSNVDGVLTVLNR